MHRTIRPVSLWTLLLLAAFIAARCVFLLEDAPTWEYVLKRSARTLPSEILPTIFALGTFWALAVLFLDFQRSRERPFAGTITIALFYLAGVSWFIFETAAALSLRVTPTPELIWYTLSNGDKLLTEFGSTAGRAPWQLGAAFLLFVAAGFTVPRLETEIPRVGGQTDVRLAAVLFAFAVLSFNGISFASKLPGLMAGAAPTVEAAHAPGDFPSKDEITPKKNPFTPWFRKRYGFNLPRGTNVVILVLESARSEFVELNRSEFFKSGPAVRKVDKFYVPIPHSSNSHFTLFTGNHSSRFAGWDFSGIKKDVTLPGVLSQAGYTCRYIYGGDTEFDRETQMLQALGIKVSERKDIARKGKYSHFDWGLDDKALVDTVAKSLSRDRGPVFYTVVFTNSHLPYFNPAPDRFNRFDNTARLGRHRNAVDYAVSLSDRIVREFKKRKKEKNTLFVLLSDHGESFGEHGFWVHDFSLHDEEIKVPFVMRHRLLSRLDDQGDFLYGTMLDVAPTLVDMLGLTLPEPVHGRSLFDRNYDLSLLLRAWGSDDYRGFLTRDARWIYDRKNGELSIERRGVASTAHVTGSDFVSALYAFGNESAPH